MSLKLPSSNACFNDTSFWKLEVKTCAGDRITPSKFELVRLVFWNIVPWYDVLDVTVKSKPERSALRKLVVFRVTPDRSMLDKSARNSAV